MRPEMTALVIHDLKNDLGALEAELAGIGPPAEAVHKHCTELRERFVMFLTLYGLDGTLRAQATDESPLELLGSLAARAARTPRVVVADAATAPPFGYFDRHLVRLALQAALHNACRFARSEVRLAARRDAGWLVFGIEDDGPGLGAADPSQHSTGLGTELCHAVARAHMSGGRAGRATLADGEHGGARFELWLP